VALRYGRIYFLIILGYFCINFDVFVFTLYCFNFVASKAQFVTCGTILKLFNTDLRLRLHSHDVKYGSGSGQQSVTGVDISDDHNSHWLIRASSGETCKRG
jgi:dolichyl-phosphate-mannose--protein O-mannosyl transferase